MNCKTLLSIMEQIVWFTWEPMKLNSSEVFLFETHCPVLEKYMNPSALHPWNEGWLYQSRGRREQNKAPISHGYRNLKAFHRVGSALQGVWVYPAEATGNFFTDLRESWIRPASNSTVRKGELGHMIKASLFFAVRASRQELSVLYNHVFS